MDEIAKQVVELGTPTGPVAAGDAMEEKNLLLPFGLQSAPKIFTTVADALEWVIKQWGVAQVYHYLDDFITLGEPGKDICARNLRIIPQICEELGLQWP